MTTQPSDHHETRQIHRLAGYACLINLGLAAMKGALAWLSGSLAIAASAIDSGSDAVASLLIYGGVKISSRKTRVFPMGLYKLENLASVVIAIFIFIAGYEIIREIFTAHGGPPVVGIADILLLAAASLVTLAFGQYAIAVGRSTESPTLIAEGRHRQVDFLSSVVVLVSVVLSYYGIDIQYRGIGIDQLGAILILIFITRAGWELLADGMRVLLDATIDIDTLDAIREIIRNEPRVVGITSLIGRSAGRFRFIQADITVDTVDLQQAHRISERIEADVRRRVKHIETVTIHYEPRQRTHTRIALPLESRDGTISSHFGEAPFFGIARIRLSDHTLEDLDVLDNPHHQVDTAKGIRVAEWLVEQDIEHVGIKEDISHKGPGYVLSSGGVSMHLLQVDRWEEGVAKVAEKLGG
jgi:cation diffusion facilitator family transporter